MAIQSYLRAWAGVILGMVLLGERPDRFDALGLAVALSGVALINWPAARGRADA